MEDIMVVVLLLGALIGWCNLMYLVGVVVGTV